MITPNIKLNPDDFIFTEIINFEGFNNFKCGDQDIDQFIKCYAKIYNDEKKFISYGLYFKNDLEFNTPLAYTTLIDDSVFLPNSSKPNKQYSAIQIGRLGVHQAYQNIGLGTIMLKSIFKFVLDDVVTVDSYKIITPFYLKNGFNYLYPDKNNTSFDKLYIVLS